MDVFVPNLCHPRQPPVADPRGNLQSISWCYLRLHNDVIYGARDCRKNFWIFGPRNGEKWTLWNGKKRRKTGGKKRMIGVGVANDMKRYEKGVTKFWRRAPIIKEARRRGEQTKPHTHTHTHVHFSVSWTDTSTRNICKTMYNSRITNQNSIPKKS